MKKKLAIALTVLTLMACASVPLVFSDRDQITLENYQRIQLGMTRQQVNEILGGPPRGGTGADYGILVLYEATSMGNPYPQEWYGRDIGVLLRFDSGDDGGKLKEKDFVSIPLRRWKSPWNTLLSLLPW
jgi:hypothetical protein